MIPLQANQIARISGGRLVAGSPLAAVNRVVIDSRQIEAGDCFVAIIGPRDDGHRYLQQALASGAGCLLVQRPLWQELVNPGDAGIVMVEDGTRALQALARHVREAVAPLVIAITGSVGKTTVKTLTHALLRDSAPTHATPGNYNNQWGLPLSLLGLQAGHRWMVAELGMSAAGEIRTLARLARPTIGVITNVAPVHMENFDSLAGVARAKCELAEELPEEGTLIVCADDPLTAAMGRELASRLRRVLTFGTREPASISCRNARPRNAGWDLELEFPGEAAAGLHLPLPGEHSIANFLAAAAVAHSLEISAATVAERAAGLELPAMRGQIYRTHDGLLVLDDSYNASPTAMMSALDTLAGLDGSGRLVLVAGDMLELGSWSEDAHREVGLHAAQSDFGLVVTVGPRARDVAHGARAGGLSADSVLSFSTPEEAADYLVRALRAGDRVLVKGSRAVGMERISQRLVQGDHERTQQEGA